MNHTNSRRNKVRLLVLTLCIGVTIVVPNVTAQATPSPVQAPTVGDMVPDCDGLTQQARAYAISHGINVCGLNVSATGGVTTQNTVAGTCGTSTILLNKIGGGNTLSVNYGFNSTLGPAALRSIVVSVGSTSGSSGGWADVSPMASNVYSAARLQTFPRHATALASLDGTITLAWGLVCYLKGPKASLYVS